MDENKIEVLKEYINKLGCLTIAYSGGVDSTFLAKAAYDVLKDKALAILADSPTIPRKEFNEAVKLANDIGIKLVIIKTDEMNIEEFVNNPSNRCYYCKKELFKKVIEVSKEHGITNVADGSNFDDINDYRPGAKAVRELEVLSPLKENKFTKEDIRYFSNKYGLPTWNKPALACLSSRFPYGDKITYDKLEMVEKAEDYLKSFGFSGLRVRHHGNIARIELTDNDFDTFLNKEIMNKTAGEFKKLGFTYVTLDLSGYKMGSLNEEL